MHTPIRFAIIGCGHIAQRHAAHIIQRGVLVAVCDIKKEKADSLATAHRARAYYDIDEMLRHEKDLQVMAVCTPNGLHASHSIKALDAGLHVLCEKPMAISTGTAREMIAAAERNNRQLMIVKQNRFNPPVQAVRQLLKENRLGSIYSFQLSCFWNRTGEYYRDWRGTKDMDGGTLFTQFSHFIDLLYWLLGDVRKTQGILSNYAHQDSIAFEDSGVVLLEMSSGATGTLNYSVNSYARNMEGSLTLLGEKGTVKIGGQYLNELSYYNVMETEPPRLAEGLPPNRYGTYEGSMSNHDKVYDNLVDVLRENAPASAGAADGLKTVEIIEKIYSSAIRV
ncbi:MAG: Gfo/Idh/MocA family oxidoreductase [Bacteroidetes bacterium]|nr:Gfo/Idh/MocA family oxidoreductase [Bacteroidota bacterium]